MRKDLKEQQESPEDSNNNVPQPIAELKEEPKVYIKPMCVSIEEMFNVINEKLDLLLQQKTS